MDDRPLALLCRDPSTRPHDGGVLVIDETGDRKDGTTTAHVAHQSLGAVGRIANGIVSVTSLWAAEDVDYPLHVVPYTPARRLPTGEDAPAFRTKPQLAVERLDAAIDAGVSFRAVVAGCLYGAHPAVQTARWAGAIPDVMGRRAQRGSRAPADDPHTPEDAARVLPWASPRQPGGWTVVVRRFRDGHRERWWAVDLRLAGMAPDKALRLVAVTTDPARPPADRTRYLRTNLPHPDAPHAATSPCTPADLPAIARLYGRRTRAEQGDNQMQQELGRTDWRERTDRAVRRHWAPVCGAFPCRWWAWRRAPDGVARPTGMDDAAQPVPVPHPGRGENAAGGRSARRPPDRPLVGGAAAGAGVAASVDPALALLARLVVAAPASAVTGAP
jgi:hypothetical protein